ncbi:hypothetical protein GQ53DRAFT_816836 [Thozetella sp. PMI_491]|nr:hypothetical protein GQ53DRAFT_816836 [Thozetella sp. PMI_491]
MARVQTSNTSSSSPDKPTSSARDIKSHPVLGYKLQVLLYDLRNLSKDPSSEVRTLLATDELYLGPPYFTAEESATIKAASVELPSTLGPGTEEGEGANSEHDQESTESTAIAIHAFVHAPATAEGTTVEQAIQSSLQNFFKKRQASGDARPCGPHDLAPIYERVFGVTATEGKDEKFLARLRRNGLEEARPTTVAGGGGGTTLGVQRKGKKGKAKRQGSE